jgi:DNA helicase-2/ATP-dependent DNA helicase PcrA
MENKTRRRDVFVGTFTRVITKSLQVAFARAAGTGEDGDDPTVATLHSHAARLLRENPPAAQGREFRFLLDHEERVMLYDIADKVPNFATNRDRSKELKLLQASWARQRTLDDERFDGAVNEWLRKNGAMLVGEVVFLATNAIQSGALAPQQFAHVFVDEYQDLTECEQTFVDLLTTEDTGSIVVLGDDDQSIYAFRYNHPEGLGTFPQDEARKDAVQKLPLPDNHRCARRIVDLANQIAAAAGSTKDPMAAHKMSDGIVDYVLWPSLDEEIEGIAEVVRSRADEKFLILVTRQFIGYRLKALIGDDAVTTFREEVLQVDFVRERFAFAALFSNESDAVALRAWLAFDDAMPTQANHRNVAAFANAFASGRRGLDLLIGIEDESVTVSGEGTQNVKTRAKKYLDDKTAMPADLVPIIETLFDPTLADTMPGRRALAGETDAARRGRERLDQQDKQKAKGDLDLLRRSAIALAGAIREPTLAKIIEDLRYRIGTHAPLLDVENEPRVRIMTLHGAKGLEEESVIVCGLANEIIPGPPKTDPEEAAEHVREQRRLLYVAVTRAKEELILSWSSTMAVVDTYNNGIVANPIPPRRITSRLTKTGPLPHRADRPETGDDWKHRQIVR